MRLICILLWITLGVSFVFTLVAFNFSANFKKDYRELDYAVHSDPLSGLANRLSADALIEGYLDKPIPRNFGAVMIDLSNIRETNELYGHLTGNALIRDFAEILNTASSGLCYVARNGGNKFLAVFEDTNEERISSFLHLVSDLVQRHNEIKKERVIRYRVGVSFNEPEETVKSVTDMIALANRRIYE